MRQLLLATIFLTAVACGGGTGIEITEARIAEPAGPNAAMYLAISNNSGDEDALIGAATRQARTAMIHETRFEDGLMKMEHVSRLAIPDGGSVTLQPGGLHVMLLDVDSLSVGDEVMVTLEFEKAGPVEISAEVVEITEG